MVEDTPQCEEPEFFDAQQAPVLQISMHALCGTPSSATAFTLKVQMGNQSAIALVDSGSVASFINVKFAIKANRKISSVDAVQVAAANGTNMISESACLSCPYTIQGHHFTSDFRLLEVKGYDIILGADWIFTHSPVGLDLKTREFSITKNGEKIITFVDEDKPAKHLLIGTKKLCQLLKKRVLSTVILMNQTTTNEEPKETEDIPEQIANLLKEFEDVFQEPTELPPYRKVDHAIALLDESKVVNQRPYRLPFHQKNAMEDLIKTLLFSNKIRPSLSPYSSPVILVRKKDGTWRMCVDYRQLNSNTVKNKYPIPIIEDLLDELFGAQIFSKIDLRSGYHQIRMREEDIPKTAFTTHMGHFEYTVLPFGLTNAPATFQTLMNSVLADFLRKFALVFFDDILIYSSTLQEHIVHLRSVLEVLRLNKLFAKLSKCKFSQSEIDYLGHIISKEGVSTDPAKIKIIVNWPVPKTVTQLRAFLGLTGYYRRFIKGYGTICRPLFDVLKKDAFQWTEAQEKSFNSLKHKMANPPVLALPDFHQPFVLEADASGNGIGAVIMQRGQPIAFFQ